jgi:hypothetical protein
VPISPIRGLIALPSDCFDLASFEWTETLAAVPEPVAFKSLADSFNDLVAAVYKRPANPLAQLFSK